MYKYIKANKLVIIRTRNLMLLKIQIICSKNEKYALNVINFFINKILICINIRNKNKSYNQVDNSTFQFLFV